MSASFSDDDLRGLFRDLSPDTPAALAVSGGSDSMALLVLAVRWAAQHGVRLLVLTVDHGLRAGSAGEAAFVKQFCESLGMEHVTLVWSDAETSSGNLPDKARSARYSMMMAECIRHGIETLVTGHTRDDQAETVLMRLGRGSGVDGLAGMRRVSHLWAGRVLRPLLDVSRDSLRSMLREEGVAWIDDPTNDDASYLRVKARRALPDLGAIGITADRLSRMAEMMAMAAPVLEEAADALDRQACARYDLGYISIDRAALRHANRETALRLLSRMLCAVSGQVYRPRLSALAALLDALTAEGGPFAGRSLHGCVLVPKGDSVLVCREPSACTASNETDAAPVFWDNRFTLQASSMRPLTIRAAGEDGLAAIRREDIDLPEGWQAAPRAARLTVPALWDHETLVAIPQAGLFLEHSPQVCDVVASVTKCASPVDLDPEAYI